MAIAPIRYKLRNWRRNAQMSQAAAAARAGVARRTWHKWELGDVVPGPAHMIELYLITGGEIEPNDFYALPDNFQREAA